MRRARPTIVLLGLAFTCCGATAGWSEPLRIALVIANAQYANFPAMARCAPAAAAARDGLRAKGFEVIERNNLGRGEFDTAIGLLARRVAASPPAVAALYYCGYAAEFNNRSFLLPVSAVLSRDNDLLTQGILVKSVVDSLRRAPDSAGLVLFDVFTPPNAPAGRMGQLAEQFPASSFAVIAASNDGPGEGATAAALGLRDELAAGDASVNNVLDGLRRRLAKEAVTVQFIAATSDARLAPEPRRRRRPRRGSTSWPTRTRCPTATAARSRPCSPTSATTRAASTARSAPKRGPPSAATSSRSRPNSRVA